jgi:hypothetical protein
MTGYQIETGDHQRALRRKAEGSSQSDSSSPVHPLLTLQSQIGNAQVARLLAQRDASEEVEAKHDLSVQRAAEEEEPVQGKRDLSVQRADDDQAQAQHENVGIEGGPVGPDTAQRISSARGGGSTLDGSTRASMEGGFRTSFEDVRVHHDAESDVLNRRLTSHAFTTGSDIFLRSDASPSDSRLMAHELTHVVQQRSMGGGGGMSVGAAGDPHESHADAMAESVLSNSAAPAQAAPAAAQREAAGEEEQVAAQHDLSVQRAAEEEEPVQGKHDLSVQRAAEEEEPVQGKHDLSVQRAAEEEEPVQGNHDLSVQRAAEEEEPVQGKHDLSVQRAAEEEEPVQGMHDLSLQRAEVTEDDVP